MSNQSPLPAEVGEIFKVDGTSFYEALKKLAEGDRITRLSWESDEDYGLLHHGKVSLHKKGEGERVFHDWIISDGDLMGLDWIIISSIKN